MGVAQAGATVTGAAWEEASADYRVPTEINALARWESAVQYAVSTQ